MTLLHTGPDVAQDAGLRYVSDQTPGWTRKPHGRGFTYLDAHGNRLPDPDAQRVRDLVIPPAWQDVWVCPDPDGHLQVTGRDQQGRKVYRYHDRWNDHRNRCKFDALVRFAHALPTIREHIARDLDQPCASRRRVLATVVQLLQSTHIRIGNDQYAKANGSYGLTTLRRKHVRIDGQHIRFEFTGKSGKQHQIDLEDAQLARSLEACSDLPGYELFKYIDEAGDKQRIDSGEVNGYLHEITGEDFTAKDFRTWAGTVIAAVVLHHLGVAAGPDEAESHIVAAVKTTAAELGNTPAVCREYYIHPLIFETYRDGSLVAAMDQLKPRLEAAAQRHHLHPAEAAVLAILEPTATD